MSVEPITGSATAVRAGLLRELGAALAEWMRRACPPPDYRSRVGAVLAAGQADLVDAPSEPGRAGLCPYFSAERSCAELGSQDPLQGLLDEVLAAVEVEDSVREAVIGQELGQNRGDVVTWDAAM